jgi:hypothetical protein
MIVRLLAACAAALVFTVSARAAPCGGDFSTFMATLAREAQAAGVSRATIDGAFAGIETGLNKIDLWIGGLAEKPLATGGLLGSTFNFVFETQLEKLQNGDRLYYLARTEGSNFENQLEEGSFAEMVMRNTGTTHLSFDIFDVPTFTIEAGNRSTFPIDPETGAKQAPIPVGNDPRALAVSDDGSFLFVAAQGDQVIQRINLSTGQIDRTFPYPSNSLVFSGPLTATMLTVPGTQKSLLAYLKTL